MKKILILIIMLMVLIQANTADAGLFGFGDDTTSSGGGDDTQYSSGGGDDTQYSSGGGDDTSYSSNAMTGDDGGVGGAGLGTQSDQRTNSELYKTPKYNPNNGGAPELSIKGIVKWLIDLINQLVYLIIGASLVVFLYGIFKLSFVDGQKPEAREQSRKFMFWGIVSLFIMVSVWGLVNILQTTFFASQPLILPQLR